MKDSGQCSNKSRKRAEETFSGLNSYRSLSRIVSSYSFMRYFKHQLVGVGDEMMVVGGEAFY